MDCSIERVGIAPFISISSILCYELSVFFPIFQFE